MRKILPLVLIAAAACAPQPPAEDAAPPAATAETLAPHSGSVLPWIADDYPAALAEARERDLPVFVESWAPW